MTADSLVLVPREATADMLANTVDDRGRPRILDFTTSEERSEAFLMPRYIYRAMIASRPPVGEEVVKAIADNLAGVHRADGAPLSDFFDDEERLWLARASLAMLEGR